MKRTGKYRFKTKEEFKEDGMWDHINDTPLYWNSDGLMDSCLGEDVPEWCEDKVDAGRNFELGDWMFGAQDCVLKKQGEYKDTSQEEKEEDIISLLRKSRVMISRMRRSMTAHPDCSEGSEFDDYTSIAQDLEDEIEDFLKTRK